MEDIALLVLSLYVVAQGAGFATKYSEKVAEGFRVPRYLVGFFCGVVYLNFARDIYCCFL